MLVSDRGQHAQVLVAGWGRGRGEVGLFYTLSRFSPTPLLPHLFLLVESDLFTLLMFDLLQESDYFTPQGEFRVDAAGSPILLNCLMYKMCYYRFGEMQVIWMQYVLLLTQLKRDQKSKRVNFWEAMMINCLSSDTYKTPNFNSFVDSRLCFIHLTT